MPQQCLIDLYILVVKRHNRSIASRKTKAYGFVPRQALVRGGWGVLINSYLRGRTSQQVSLAGDRRLHKQRVRTRAKRGASCCLIMQTDGMTNGAHSSF